MARLFTAERERLFAQSRHIGSATIGGAAFIDAGALTHRHHPLTAVRQVLTGASLAGSSAATDKCKADADCKVHSIVLCNFVELDCYGAHVNKDSNTATARTLTPMGLM